MFGNIRISIPDFDTSPCNTIYEFQLKQLEIRQSSIWLFNKYDQE